METMVAAREISAEDRKPADIAHSRVFEALERLDVVLTHGEDKLAFVLRPDATPRDMLAAAQIAGAPLTETFNAIADRIEQAADRLARTLDRVDLPR